MQTITLNSHVGQDGILHLDIPVDITDTDITVETRYIASLQISVKPVKDDELRSPPQGKGWPEHFFEETSGCLKDTPLTMSDRPTKPHQETGFL